MVNSLSWPLIDRHHDAAIAGEGNLEIGRDIFMLYMARIDEMYIQDGQYLAYYIRDLITFVSTRLLNL